MGDNASGERFESLFRRFEATLQEARDVREAIVGSSGGFVGMHSFGESGPAGEVYKKFGITADAVVELAKSMRGTAA